MNDRLEKDLLILNDMAKYSRTIGIKKVAARHGVDKSYVSMAVVRAEKYIRRHINESK